MKLSGAGYPKEMLNKFYLDWTPEEAELVRLHFLGPLVHVPHWKDTSLIGTVYAVSGLRNFTAEEEYLAKEARMYSRFGPSSTGPSTPSLTEKEEEAAAQAKAAASPATSAETQNS